MHDFDYDAMQKKRIARGAIHMKNGSKSKKCSLPHDGLTPAQLRRLNGPVSTYKLDEPMNWESFKAMPEDLQKKYICGLQDTYQANDNMLAVMFGVNIGTIVRTRKKIGLSAYMTGGRLSKRDIEIRDAKWEAFCNGVVGGKPGNVEVIEDTVEPVKEEEPVIASLYNDDIPIIRDPIQTGLIKDALDLAEKIVDIPRPERLDVTYIKEIDSVDDIMKMIKPLRLPNGKCRIRISIEKL